MGRVYAPQRVGGAPNLSGGHLGIGAGGYLISGIEASKGTPAAVMDDFAPVSAITIGASFDVLRKSVFYGSRHAEQVIRVLKGKVAGNITHSWMAESSAPFLYVGLGKEIYLPASTADGTTAAATDTAGLTTLTLGNTGGNTYVMGALAQYGAAPNFECVQIVGITGNGAAGTVVQVKGLKNTTPRTTGTSFTQLGQHKFTMRGPLDSQAWDLPTMTLEKNKGRQYAWQLPGSRVAKFEMKGGKEDIEITETMVCTVDPIRLDPPGGGVLNPYTAFSPSQQQRAELTRPFTIRDSYVVVPNDQAATGTAVLNRLAEIEEVTIGWDNHFIDKDFWNEHRIKDSFPGTTKGTVAYKYSSSAGRPSEYEDDLAVEGAPPVPFFLTSSINFGSPAVPVWHAGGVYVPAMLVTKTDNPDTMNDLLAANVEAEIVDDDIGSDPLQIFIANSKTAAYAGT